MEYEPCVSTSRSVERPSLPTHRHAQHRYWLGDENRSSKRSPVATPADLRNRVLALGSRDSAHAAILPVHFLEGVAHEHLVPEGALTEIWTSPPYNHCMFTARPYLDPPLNERFAEALSGMNYDNPSHRALPGLRRWELPHLDGYDSLRQAAERQGFFNRPMSKSSEA